MKKIILSGCLMIGILLARGQVVINVQLPAMGLVMKSQLWNLTIINTSSSDIQAQVSVLFTNVANNQKVFSGTSKLITLSRGAKQVTYNDVLPVTYNILNTGYNVDAAQEGFLPIGTFDVCYQVIRINTDFSETLGEQCETVDIDPISPPQLVSPYDSERVEITRPLFTWLPPSPYNLFNNLQYDYTLVQVLNTQSAADAIQQNIPLYAQSGITTTSLQYPVSVAELDTASLYAWQVTAKSGGSPVSKSEIWSFRIQHFNPDTNKVFVQNYYVKLKRENDASYIECKGMLRFEYLNEWNDKVVNVKLYDISSASRQELNIDSSLVNVDYGINFKSIDFTIQNLLVNKHIYQFELINSKQEHWYVKFEYQQNN